MVKFQKNYISVLADGYKTTAIVQNDNMSATLFRVAEQFGF